MKIRLIAVLMGALVFTGIFAGGARAQQQKQKPAAAYTIEVGGSTSVTPLMERFAAAYATVRPNARVNINGTGSGDGINNAGKLYQIGMSSRDLTPVEQGSGLRQVTVAIDGIAVIVNTANPVGNLTVEQIRGIYTGEITDWGKIPGNSRSGRIAVVSREAGSGTRGAFEEIVGFQNRLVAGSTESTSTGAIIATVAGNPDAIGYISLGSINNTIKAVLVGGVAPSSANVLNGTYRIARPFIVLTGSNVHAESTAFVDWMLGPEGQKIVKDGNWIPAKP